MNLQQLNENGQPLWVFITTAMIATALTAIVWFCIDQTNRVRLWKSLEVGESRNGFFGSPHYSIGVRLAMIQYLIKMGHTKWMRESNVWLHVLINSSKPGINVEPESYSLGSYYCTPAGHFVTKYKLHPRDFELGFQHIRW